MKRTALYSLLVAIVFVSACKSDQSKANSGTKADRFAVSHQRMVDTLAYIAQHADPALLYNLNLARATGIQQQLEMTQDPNLRTPLYYSLTQELLAAGKLDDAIAIQGLTSQLPLEANTKHFYDAQALAYLRFGEVTNCLGNHTAESCILPIKALGQHRDQTGSQKAIELYENILKSFPDDLQSRYLPNIAYQTLGLYPKQVPKTYLISSLDAKSQDRQFIDIAMDHSAHQGHQGMQHEGIGVNGLSGGVSLGDFNGDGHTDIFATSYGLTHPAKIFLGDGKGGFSESEANLSGITDGLNCQAADYDNDGDLDVLVLRGGWFGAGGAHPNSLLRNDGTGRFTDVTFALGLSEARPSQTASWSDFDLDGDLDLFIGNEASKAAPYQSQLYLNEGELGFRENAQASGIELVAMVKGVTAGDVNGDGYPDLYASCLGQPNRLFLNRALPDSDPQFIEIAKQAGVEEPIESFPTWFFDYDQDGDLDLFVAGYDTKQQGDAAGIEAAVRLGLPSTAATMHLYQNDGSGKFKDVSKEVNLARPAYVMGSNYADINLDGFPDLYLGTGTPDLRSIVPNILFINKGGKSFNDESFVSGLPHIQKGHGVGFADFDRDDDLDIYTVLGGAFEGDNFPNALFQNRGISGSWIGFNLQGASSNRSAIGARLAIFASKGAQPIVRYATVGTGSSFGGNDLEVQVGLAGADKIDSVRIWWPSIKRNPQVLTKVKINNVNKVVQEDRI